MVKKIAFVVLVFSFIFFVRESLLTWRESYEVNLDLQEAKTISGSRAVQKVTFYPSPPSPLPDVAENYIFNAERHLVTEKEKKQAENKEVEEQVQGPEIDMEELVYSGSIIIGENRKALISYKEKVEKQAGRPFPGRRGAGRNEAGERRFALLGVSDQLGRYKVVAVEPDRIIFHRNGESVEKMLYEQNINRIIPPSVRERQPERQPESRSEHEQEQDKQERRTVIFSSRPGDKDSPGSGKKGSREEEKNIRIPFR